MNRRLLLGLVGMGIAAAAAFGSARSTPPLAPIAPLAASALSPDDCGAGFDLPDDLTARCGMVRVDRPDGIGGSLSLWTVVVEPETASTSVPLLVVPGGPGVSGTRAGSIDYQATWFRSAFENRPVVYVDPRGVGRSGGLLDCVPYEFQDPTACFEAIIPPGINKSLYASESIADDYDALRVALGYEVWDLFGLSYGGEVTQHMMRNHPDTTRSAVLAASTSVEVPQGTDTASQTQSTVSAAIADCAADVGCNGGFDNFEVLFQDLLARLEARPIATTYLGEPYEIDDAALLDATLAAMGDWRQLPNLGPLVISLTIGDPAIWHQLRDFTQGQAPDWSEVRDYYVSDLLLRTLTFCLDGGAGQHHESPADERFVRHAGDPRSYSALCDGIGISEPSQGALTPPSAVPALVILGRVDAVVPREQPQMIAAALDHATLVELAWYGHQGFWEDACPQQLMLTFWADPLAELDTGCVDDLTWENIYGTDCSLDRGTAVALYCP